MLNARVSGLLLTRSIWTSDREKVACVISTGTARVVGGTPVMLICTTARTEAPVAAGSGWSGGAVCARVSWMLRASGIVVLAALRMASRCVSMGVGSPVTATRSGGSDLSRTSANPVCGMVAPRIPEAIRMSALERMRIGVSLARGCRAPRYGCDIERGRRSCKFHRVRRISESPSCSLSSTLPISARCHPYKRCSHA